MTLQEAKEALSQGFKIRHYHFADNEYIQNVNGQYFFEDGVAFSWGEFFRWRNKEAFMHSWEVIDSVKAGTPDAITTTALTEGRKAIVVDDEKTYQITNKVMPWDEEEKIIIPPPYIRASKKVYPNDPCTCGSGKKFKKCCHGKNKVRSNTSSA